MSQVLPPVSATRRGTCPKLPNDATKFLDGTGNWTVPPGSAPAGGPAAALNYNAITNTIRNSTNVTSVTDRGTGQFTVNFTTALSTANYYSAGVCSLKGGVSFASGPNIDPATPPTTTAYAFETPGASGGANYDFEIVHLLFFV